MTITEKNFQAAVNIGGIALGLSVVLNIYCVMRNREVYRDQVKMELKFQQLLVQQQAMEGSMREIVARAGNDPKLAAILQRYQIISGGSQSTQVKP